MARQPRLTLPHHPHHIVWRGNNRQAIFVDAQDQRLMLNLLLEASRQYKVAIHSYVLMTNHLHLLATPTEVSALSLMMQQIGRSYVRLFNQRQSRSGTLFEGRYKSAVVQTERYLLACMAYIDLNPVRAGMVSEPQQYPWSSFAHYAGLQTDPLITPHPHFWSLGNTPFAREAAYGDLVRAGLSGADERALTHSAQRGGVLAQDDYMAELEKTTQKRLRPGVKGRPLKTEDLSTLDVFSKKKIQFSDAHIK
jgi:putative transposase